MKKLLLLCVLLGGVLMIVAPSMAIAPPYSANITSFTDYSSDCGQTTSIGTQGLQMDVAMTADGVDDETGPGVDGDTFYLKLSDANGVLLAESITYVLLGSQQTRTEILFINPDLTLYHGVPRRIGSAPTARPWQIIFQDYFSQTNTRGAEVSVLTFDPADYVPACESLPYIGIEEDDAITINDVSSANEVSIYESTDESGAPSLNLYDVDEDGNGTYALTITQDDIAPFDGNPPSENTEILTSIDGNIRVFVLNTGEIQVNSGPDEEGKIRVVIMDGIPPTNTYGYTIDPPSAG